MAMSYDSTCPQTCTEYSSSQMRFQRAQSLNNPLVEECYIFDCRESIQTFHTLKRCICWIDLGKDRDLFEFKAAVRENAML